MLSPETLESYRRMTPGQRLRLTFDLTGEATKALLAGSPETIDRRLMLLSKQNDHRNQAMLSGIARTRTDLNAK